MQRRLLASAGFTIAVLTLVVSGGMVHAQTSENSIGGDAIRVAPIRSEAVIQPGTSKTFEVNVTNLSNVAVTYQAITNDFGASDDESGQAKLFLDEQQSDPKHGLKKYISAIENFTVQPNERKTVRVVVAIPAKAAGGGYFGAVRFAQSNAVGSKMVNLSGSVGSLLLVTVPGDVVEQASIASMNVARTDGDKLGKASNLFTNGGKKDGKGLQAVVRIKNSGNVQLAPFGKVILKKSGKEIASYEINSSIPRSNVLPDSVRRFTVDLDDKTSSFGKYTVVGNFGYGNKGQLIAASTSFYVIPLSILLVGIGLLLILIAAILILPRMLKSHDRKLLRKVRGHK